MKNKNAFPKILNVLPREKIGIKHSIHKQDGMQIFPATIEDHRILSKLLEINNQEYFTNNLPEEETFLLVICGVPGFVGIADKFELKGLGFDVVSLNRMFKKTPEG